MPVPYAFANASVAIPLSQLDSNFNTPIVIGNTAIQLGNSVTTLSNIALSNVTITANPFSPIPANSGGTGVTSAGLFGNVLTSVGNVWISRAIPGTGNGAPVGAPYVLMFSVANLTSGRILTAGANATITDSGPGNAVTIDASSGVTSVTATAPVSSSGGITPAISLSANYGDTQNPYASKTANYVLASPNGSSGVPTFRAIVAADIPTLNQNTTGTAAGLSSTLAVTSGGTGVTTSTGSGSVVLSNSPTLVTPALGTPSSGNLANCTFPTLNQNTTGTAAGLSTTLAVSSGGTGLTSTPANGQIDIGNGSGFTRTTLTAGANVTITNTAGGITISSAGGGGGTVTSVSGTGTVNGISLSGTVTSSGNLTLGGTLSGVSLTSQVSGTLPIANGGTGTASTTFVNLASNVAGTLPVANGGTGATTLAANNVLLGNGTSALQVVAPGTNGNVLTSNGSTWISSAPAGGGGSMTLISTKTASVSANLSWTGLSGYSKYLLIFQNLVPDIGSGGLILQFGTGSGPTYLTSNYYWNSASFNNSTITASGTNLNSCIELYTTPIGSGTDGVSGYCYIESMLSGSITSVNSHAYYLTNNTIIGSGCHATNTSAKTAILISFTSFNINSGSASLYGISS